MKAATLFAIPVFALAGCMQDLPDGHGTASDACGASQYQDLVGGPSSAAMSLRDIPGSSRHYGSEERTATNDPTRLNFVHSGTAIEAVIDPDSTIIRVFCG